MCGRTGGSHFPALCNEGLPCHVCLEALRISARLSTFSSSAHLEAGDRACLSLRLCAQPQLSTLDKEDDGAQSVVLSYWDSGLFCFSNITSLVLTDWPQG